MDFYLQERKKDFVASRFIHEKHLENIPHFYKVLATGVPFQGKSLIYNWF